MSETNDASKVENNRQQRWQIPGADQEDVYVFSKEDSKTEQADNEFEYESQVFKSGVETSVEGEMHNQSSPVGTQGDVHYDQKIFNQFFSGEAPKPEEDLSEPTYCVVEDVPELDQEPALELAKECLLNHHVIAIEQDIGDRSYCGSIINKLRFDFQDHFQFRDSKQQQDLTLYYRRPELFRYGVATATVIYAGLNQNAVKTLLNKEDFDRLRQALCEQNNYLIIVTRTELEVVREQLANPIDSELHIWRATARPRESSGSTRDEIHALFQDENKLKGFILFLLTMFPGLDVSQFNEAIQLWLKHNPAPFRAKSDTQPTTASAEEGSVEPNPVPEPELVLDWQNDADELVQQSFGAYCQDEDGVWGYRLCREKQGAGIREYLLDQYPFYCRQHCLMLFLLYQHAPLSWSGFREQYLISLLVLLQKRILVIESDWLIEHFEQCRLNSDDNYIAFNAFVWLLQSLRHNQQTEAILQRFHESLTQQLIREQSMWRQTAIEREKVELEKLFAFREKISDFFITLQFTVGFSRPYAEKLIRDLLADSHAPFWIPNSQQDSIHWENLFFPASYYSKVTLQSIFPRNFELFAAYLCRLEEAAQDEYTKQTPLGIRSEFLLAYSILFDMAQRAAHPKDEVAQQFARNWFQPQDEQQKENPVLKLLNGQLRIVLDIGGIEAYSRWLEYLCAMLERLCYRLVVNNEQQIVEVDQLAQFIRHVTQTLPKPGARILKRNVRQKLERARTEFSQQIERKPMGSPSNKRLRAKHRYASMRMLNQLLKPGAEQKASKES